MSYKPGDSLNLFFNTLNASGTLTNADSTPAATLVHNGTDDGDVELTVTNPATGRYEISGTIPSSGYVSGDKISIRVSASVSSVAGELFPLQTILDGDRVSDVATGVATAASAATTAATNASTAASNASAATTAATTAASNAASAASAAATAASQSTTAATGIATLLSEESGLLTTSAFNTKVGTLNSGTIAGDLHATPVIQILPLTSVVGSGEVKANKIVAYQTANFGPFTFTIVDQNGNPSNLSGHAITFVASTRSGTYLWEIASCPVSGAGNNIVTVSQASNTNTMTAADLLFTLWDTTTNKPIARGCLLIDTAVAAQ